MHSRLQPLATHSRLQPFVMQAPQHAVGQFGFAILEAEPQFATELSGAQLLSIAQLSAGGLRDDANWATCRRVVSIWTDAPEAPRGASDARHARVVGHGLHAGAATALRLSIDLFKASREAQDLQLLRCAYHAVDGFTRKQVWLPTELGPLWATFHAALQREVIEGALPAAATLNGMFADGVPQL